LKLKARSPLTPLAFYHVPAARRGRRRPTPFHAFPLASPLGVERWTLGVGRWALGVGRWVLNQQKFDPDPDPERQSAKGTGLNGASKGKGRPSPDRRTSSSRHGFEFQSNGIEDLQYRSKLRVSLS
jgi:hypothetical protein